MLGREYDTGLRSIKALPPNKEWVAWTGTKRRSPMVSEEGWEEIRTRAARR
jgi:hypothetical protein